LLCGLCALRGKEKTFSTAEHAENAEKNLFI
jgi:hypothetical protein